MPDDIDKLTNLCNKLETESNKFTERSSLEKDFIKNAKNLLSTLKFIFIIFGLAIVSEAIRMEIITTKNQVNLYNNTVKLKELSDQDDLVTNRIAMAAEKWRISNNERIYNELTDDAEIMAIIKSYDATHISVLEDLYKIEF